MLSQVCRAAVQPSGTPFVLYLFALLALTAGSSELPGIGTKTSSREASMALTQQKLSELVRKTISLKYRSRGEEYNVKILFEDEEWVLALPCGANVPEDIYDERK